MNTGRGRDLARKARPPSGTAKQQEGAGRNEFRRGTNRFFDSTTQEARRMANTDRQAAPRTSADEPRIKIVSHSDLFYWWPVWAVGFLMAFLTYQGGNHMAIVPD